jgi:hypothetical protein
MRPPELLRVFFWDVDFDRLDCNEHADLIVTRVAEYGTDEAVRWLRASYEPATIAAALERNLHRVSSQTLGLWRLWLGKPEGWCTSEKTASRPLSGLFWKR